ncbi:MAG: hypothetical protein HKN25_04475 [Pyrinomonadaceae bacterium]|nr:hypothetical protein [Pyrinomonadaceae bacterium]
MKRLTIIIIALFLWSVPGARAQGLKNKQISIDILSEIVNAENELRYDMVLGRLMNHPSAAVRKRAALAAGRIGDENAVSALGQRLLEDDTDVRQMAAFAIGEIESANGAAAIRRVLENLGDNAAVRAKAIEAAGKISAANPKNEVSKQFGPAIIKNLDYEAARRSKPNRDVVLLGITAVLRAKPENAEVTVAKFLSYSDPRIRADALNTLSRLRAKNINERAKALLRNDGHPVVRAKAARVLGAAADKTAIDVLVKAASEDSDLRVRVNAIRALSVLGSAESATVLLKRAGVLMRSYKSSKFDNPTERNELLTISTAIGRILKGSKDVIAVKFLEEFRVLERHRSPEVEVALVRVSPEAFAETKLPKDVDWQGTRGFVAGLSEAADLKEEDGIGIKDLKTLAQGTLGAFITNARLGKEKIDKSFPAALRAYAKFETEDLRKVLLDFLLFDDVLVRSTAASLLGDVKPKTSVESAQNYRALSNALWQARTDKLNDASLTILGALEKQYKNRKAGLVKFSYMSPFISAMGSPDYLIRRRAAEIYRRFDIKKPDRMTVGDPDFESFEIPVDIGIVRLDKAVGENGSRSRVFLADYKRALSRKNGEWKAILETQKGEFAIGLFPEDAPLTVDNFIQLAKSGYFDGLEIHRVVPNFVVQDGDPRGDGSGGPGWQIRCEINQIPYDRGMVGMALSGKDTGGSQWFVTHSPQPHLDGGYTVFGKVNENHMQIVDKLVRGDKILRVRVVKE